jgi:pimeloyl-ACP methyl ester carboxylesterase
MSNFRTIIRRVADGIDIETIELWPYDNDPFCTIIFSTGICMDCRDLMELLGPLSDFIRVVAYNYRGHGSSSGVFDLDKVSSDLQVVVSHYREPIFLMGYSTGCGVNALTPFRSVRANGYILLSPYLDRYYLSRARRLALKSAGYLSGPLGFADSVLTATGLAKRLGFKNKLPLVDVTKIDRMQSPQRPFYHTPALWMIPDRDEVLGTWMNQTHLEEVRARLKWVYPAGTDRSDLVSGLNHLFNTQVGNLFNAFSCPNNTKNAMIETILDFCRANI